MPSTINIAPWKIVAAAWRNRSRKWMSGNEDFKWAENELVCIGVLDSPYGSAGL